jgi:formylglycine-generating enzyme required for sulfatase activity
LFLEQQQPREPLGIKRTESVLKVLCQAAAALQDIHRRHYSNGGNDERCLLLPTAAATLHENRGAVCTQLVRLRLLASPRLEPQVAWFEPLGKGVALTMVAISAGSFLMGSPPGEKPRSDNEGPQHRVNLHGFWISQTPTTQAQWRQVMDSDSSTALRSQDDLRPVGGISWFNAMEFCRRLSELTHRYYTLPSEAQWEYSCRAGTSTPFNSGAFMVREYANVQPFPPFDEDHEWGDFPTQYSAVGQFPANQWGICNTHGSVREWCLDHWHESYEGAPNDGSAWVQ